MSYVNLENGTKVEVKTIYCVGRNYADHAKEMGADLPIEPLIFLKPATAIISNGIFTKPHYSNEAHYEGEISVLIGKDCENVSEDNAINYAQAIGVGCDFTLRDVQTECKQKGLPWAKAKSFKGSAIFSYFHPIENFNGVEWNIKLYKDGELKQKGSSKQLIFSLSKVIAYLSSVYSLRKGDIIMLGTPEGVGKLESGNQIKIDLNEKIFLEFKVA